jgi:hypothetical protein
MVAEVKAVQRGYLAPLFAAGAARQDVETTHPRTSNK